MNDVEMKISFGGEDYVIEAGDFVPLPSYDHEEGDWNFTPGDILIVRVSDGAGIKEDSHPDEWEICVACAIEQHRLQSNGELDD